MHPAIQRRRRPSYKIGGQAFIGRNLSDFFTLEAGGMSTSYAVRSAELPAGMAVEAVGASSEWCVVSVEHRDDLRREAGGNIMTDLHRPERAS